MRWGSFLSLALVCGLMASTVAFKSSVALEVEASYEGFPVGMGETVRWRSPSPLAGSLHTLTNFVRPHTARPFLVRYCLLLSTELINTDGRWGNPFWFSRTLTLSRLQQSSKTSQMQNTSLSLMQMSPSSFGCSTRRLWGRSPLTSLSSICCPPRSSILSFSCMRTGKLSQ